MNIHFESHVFLSLFVWWHEFVDKYFCEPCVLLTPKINHTHIRSGMRILVYIPFESKVKIEAIYFADFVNKFRRLPDWKKNMFFLWSRVV